MEFTIHLKAVVVVEKAIKADNWEGAAKIAKTLEVAKVIPTPNDFTFVDVGETEIQGIFI